VASEVAEDAQHQKQAQLQQAQGAGAAKKAVLNSFVNRKVCSSTLTTLQVKSAAPVRDLCGDRSGTPVHEFCVLTLVGSAPALANLAA
jgi:hypothetical protein